MHRYNDLNENNQKTKMGRKTAVWLLPETNKRNFTEGTWTWLRKGNLKRETESFLIAARNNAIRTKYVKAKIDKIADVDCGDRDETINHIISECCKLAQREYKTRHDWEGKVIHGELCNKFEFDHTNKWYLYNPESVLENETHKILWDFEIQTDHLISTRRPDRVNKKKKKENLPNCGFSRSR